MVYICIYLEIKLEKEVIRRARALFECTCASLVKMEFVRILDACANSFLPFSSKLKIKQLVQVSSSGHSKRRVGGIQCDDFLILLSS